MSLPIYATEIKEMFPSTKTQTINKLLTENSLTRLLNRLLDVESYIITSEFDENDKNILKGVYDFIPLNNYANILEKDVEICIRGYYFNLGDYRTLRDKLQSSYGSGLSEGDKINAVIFVDEKSNPEYPELYGQFSFNPWEVPVITGDYTIEFSDPNHPENSTIDNIRIYNGNEEIFTEYEFKVDKENDNYILKYKSGNDWYDVKDIGYPLSDWDLATAIKYTEETNTAAIWLYKEGADPSSSDRPSGKEFKDLTAYELTLFEYTNTNRGFEIPLSSIHRFSSLAIELIDGGEIRHITEQ